ncbi:Major facilitator superfamily (MFS) profile domain-containing protein [Pararobbsia alpina]|uniref:MFS transporter n=1 Tax=Pararobbsia alpina TaxID=621374 RepID=UPI0039A5884E
MDKPATHNVSTAATGIASGDTHRAAFWTAAAVIVHTLWTSAAPAMTYPIYAREWHLSAPTVAAIFAVYPLAVVLTLMFLGDLSDHIGRRGAMLLGLCASILGVGAFAIAPDVTFLFAGRVLMGLGVGLSAGAAAAALVDFAPAGHAHLASVVNTVAQGTGLAAATLIGGALIEFAPYPTRLNYLALMLYLVVVFIMTWRLPRASSHEQRAPWRPRLMSVPKESLDALRAAAPAAATSFMLGSVVLSAGAQIAHDLVRSSHPLVNGSVIALFALVWGAATLLFKRRGARTLVSVGGIATVVAMGLLVRASTAHSLAVFLLAIAAGGFAYSLLFLGGVSYLVGHTAQTKRAAALSSLYFACYLVQVITAMGLGEAIAHIGIGHAIRALAIIVSLSAIASIIALELRSGRFAKHAGTDEVTPAKTATATSKNAAPIRRSPSGTASSL